MPRLSHFDNFEGRNTQEEQISIPMAATMHITNALRRTSDNGLYSDPEAVEDGAANSRFFISASNTALSVGSSRSQDNTERASF